MQWKFLGRLGVAGGANDLPGRESEPDRAVIGKAGILLALRRATEVSGVTVGLDALLDLGLPGNTR